MVSTDLYNWTRVSGTAAGTTTITGHYGNLKSIVMGENKTGTVSFYDVAGATTAATQIFALNNTSGTSPLAIDVNCRFKNGLVAVTGGTTDMTVFWN
jgi:hypothetical protein